MNPVSILLLGWPRAAFRRSLKHTLGQGRAPDEIFHIWKATELRQKELRSKRPKHSFGVDQLLRTFEWDCALYQVLKGEGLSSEAAGTLVEEVTWGVFGPAIELSFKVARLRSRRLRTRVEWILDRMFGLLFTAPFERTKRPSAGGIDFDVTVCPLADYFRGCGVPELTGFAACRLDHRLARVWGVRLERQGTLAEGHPLCDFRFRIPGYGVAPADPLKEPPEVHGNPGSAPNR